MKYIFLALILASQLFSSVIKSPILNVNSDETQASIKVDKVDIGMSGFVYHDIADGHGVILKNAVVTGFNKNTNIAQLKLSDYDALANSALPSGKWHVEKGNEVILAFGYTRGLLIAPSEEIYYRISRNTDIQWVHPDIFATILSFNSHPAPTLEDFSKMSIATSAGLVFVFLEDRVYTLDSKSFKILNISAVKLTQDSVKLPFYTRVPEISTSWFAWGEGTSKLDEYEPHYYDLLVQANPRNRTLYNIVKNSPQDINDLLGDFELKGK